MHILRFTPDPNTCGLCLSSEGIIDKEWKSTFFHRDPCYAGMRSNQQQMANIPGAMKADTEKFRTDRPGWIQDNMKHANPETRKEALQDNKKKYVDKCTIETVEDVEPELELSKKHFKGWKRVWEGQSDDSASEEFDGIYDQQGLHNHLKLKG